MKIVTPEQGELQAGFLRSEALDGRRSYFAYLPPSYDADGSRRFPCVWLLHGMYGAESDWVVKGRAPLTAERLMAAGRLPEAVLVFPSDGLSGDGTWYRNSRDYGRVADYFAELLDHAEATWRIDEGERPHAIIGLSMGGFGAMYLSDRYRQRVRAAYSHSGALGPQRDENLYERLIQGQAGTRPLQLGADCGVDDFLIDDNRAWHTALEESGVSHHYAEHPGAHTWEYWSQHVATSLQSVGRSFG